MNHYRINEIKTEIGADQEIILKILGSKLKLRAEDIFKWEIRRRSIDARDKSDVHYVYAVDVWTEKELIKNSQGGKKAKGSPAGKANQPAKGSPTGKANQPDKGRPTGKANQPVKIHGLSVQYIEVGAEDEEPLALGNEELKGRVVVVGMGPCGLFAALELAEKGYRPLVIERGPEMAERIREVENFRRSGLLNPEGNMLFGEGGAGTFSDGKIGTGIKDGNIRKVLRMFADAGAGDEITYLNKPHIGTDVLREVIVNMRKQLIELGGEVRFNTKLNAINLEGGQLRSIEIVSNSGAGVSCERDVFETIETNAMVLAIGHSARDTFAMINEKGLAMQQKPFSIGVRMEHPQSMIDLSQYGELAIEKYGTLLPPADYKLSTKTSNGRGVYSFCMCPGGEVVVCTTEEGELCVNGMSNRRRDSGTANSGILCDVRCEDYNNGNADDVLAGVRFQEKYERLAFENGQKCRRKPLSMLDEAARMRFNPPNCSMGEFLDAGKCGKADDFEGIGGDKLGPFEDNGGDKPRHFEGSDNAEAVINSLPDFAAAVINSLPDFAAEAIREAVPTFARKIAGYDNPEAIITAVETRSSSPVRIVRDENGQSNVAGIYPAGEGAGYAGGITSAACDGIRAARAIMRRFSN